MGFTTIHWPLGADELQTNGKTRLVKMVSPSGDAGESLEGTGYGGNPTQTVIDFPFANAENAQAPAWADQLQR